ncbi:MAG: hypothetical protein FWE74_10060 [Oscillospiraceae bacterium]|nr:hypothetical protein [Oscillospiraceae bacterium]
MRGRKGKNEYKFIFTRKKLLLPISFLTAENLTCLSNRQKRNGTAHAKAHLAEMPPTCSVHVCADVKFTRFTKAESAYFLISVQLYTTETVQR